MLLNFCQYLSNPFFKIVTICLKTNCLCEDNICLLLYANRCVQIDTIYLANFIYMYMLAHSEASKEITYRYSVGQKKMKLNFANISVTEDGIQFET